MRLFIALPLPPAVTALLEQQQRALARMLPDVPLAWTTAEQQHLTLVFLGERPETELSALEQALSFACRRSAPFQLETAQPGAFPSLRRPSVLWTGVAGNVPELRQLHDVLFAQLEGLHAPDRRGFAPHLTLGRLKKPGHAGEVAAAFAALQSSEPVAWTVDEVRLYSSALKPDGPRYATVSRYALT